MNQKFSGNSLESLKLNPQSVKMASFKSSVKALVTTGAPTTLAHCASETGVRLKILSKTLQYYVWQTVEFEVSGKEKDLLAFQQMLINNLK